MMTSEKNKTKEGKQAKDKRGAKKALGTLSQNLKGKVHEYLLYMSPDGLGWLQSPGRPPVAKGQLRGFLKVRLESFTPTVFQMQYSLRGKRGGVLLKNVEGNRAKSYAKTPRRQKDRRKSPRTLPEFDKGLRAYIRRIK